MEIRINQQYAKIGLNITKPFLSLHTTLPVLEIQTQNSEIKIKPSSLELSIDQSECFADVNLRNNTDFARYCNDQARSDTLAGIDRIVAEGNQLAAIEQGGTLEQIAGNALDNQVDYNIAMIPKQRPKIEWNLKPLEIEATHGSVTYNLQPGKVENQFQRGQVEVYLLQKNHLEISWVGDQFDKSG